MRKLLFLLMVAVLLVAGSAMAVTADIQNPGFELPVIGGTYQSGGIIGWAGAGADYGLLAAPGGNPGQYAYFNDGVGKKYSHTQSNFTKRFCIDRHDMAINVAFVDGSTDKVPLRELWTLQWSKKLVNKRLICRRETNNLLWIMHL